MNILLDSVCICRAVIQKVPFHVPDMVTAEQAPTFTHQAKVTQMTCALHYDSENPPSLCLSGS